MLWEKIPRSACLVVWKRQEAGAVSWGGGPGRLVNWQRQEEAGAVSLGGSSCELPCLEEEVSLWDGALVRACICFDAHGSHYGVTGCSDEVPLLPRITPLSLSHAREKESMSSSAPSRHACMWHLSFFYWISKLNDIFEIMLFGGLTDLVT